VSAFAELEAVLDRAPAPVRFFFRDDDAGWAEDELFALLERFDARRTPLDLAVIPAALEADAVTRLRERIEATGGRVRVHQHGFEHVDHQQSGRRCEFGSDRLLAKQREDVRLGVELLARRFRELRDPIFTPPWNRCVEALGPILLEAGLLALSRDRSAGRLSLPGLEEIPITVDWLAPGDGSASRVACLGARLARSAERDAAVGVMLHHAEMDANELTWLDALLELLDEHPRARRVPMRSLLRGRS
jgi:hypothetical protein